MQFFDEWLAVVATADQALLGGKTVDLPFDVEQGVDPLDSLKRQRRDRRSLAATLGVRGNIGQHEELAACVCPAQRLRQWRGIAIILNSGLYPP